MGITIKILVGVLKLSRYTPVLTSISGIPFLPTLLSLVSPTHHVVTSFVAGIALLFFDFAGRSAVVVAS